MAVLIGCHMQSARAKGEAAWHKHGTCYRLVRDAMNRVETADGLRTEQPYCQAATNKGITSFRASPYQDLNNATF
jgi:hypothetical protein